MAHSTNYGWQTHLNNDYYECINYGNLESKTGQSQKHTNNSIFFKILNNNRESLFRVHQGFVSCAPKNKKNKNGHTRYLILLIVLQTCMMACTRGYCDRWRTRHAWETHYHRIRMICPILHCTVLYRWLIKPTNLCILNDITINNNVKNRSTFLS